MSHLLWWYLDDVLPLAEHAMACVEHRPTREETLAGLQCSGALVWATTPTAHRLTSNGEPTFHGPTGAPHAATARTWRHLPTGVIGGSGHPCEERRFWPPGTCHRDGRAPLINILRQGRRHHGHWLVVDTDPTSMTGRRRLAVRDHRDDLVPPAAIWVEAKVTADMAAHLAYPALVADGSTIDGDDLIARFTRDVVEEMVHELFPARVDSAPGTVAVLGFDGPVLRVCVEHPGPRGMRLRELDRVRPDREGRYAVGAFLWPWHPAPTAMRTGR